MDSLILEGVHCGSHTTSTSVGSHYGGVDFNAVGCGYASGKSESDTLAIGSATARGTEVLVSKMVVASIRL